MVIQWKGTNTKNVNLRCLYLHDASNNRDWYYTLTDESLCKLLEITFSTKGALTKYIFSKSKASCIL